MKTIQQFLNNWKLNYNNFLLYLSQPMCKCISNTTNWLHQIRLAAGLQLSSLWEGPLFALHIIYHQTYFVRGQSQSLIVDQLPGRLLLLGLFRSPVTDIQALPGRICTPPNFCSSGFIITFVSIYCLFSCSWTQLHNRSCLSIFRQH